MKVKTNKLLQLEYKRFFTNKLWICIAIFLLVNSTIWGYKYKEHEEDTIYNEMVEEYRGKATPEKIKQITERTEYYKQVINIYLEVTDDYARGKISDEQFENYIEDYKYAKYHIKALERLSTHAKRFSKVNSETYFFYDVSWIKLFQNHIEWPFIFLVVILFVPYFYLDYDSGIYNVNASYYRYRSVLHFRLKFSVFILMFLQTVWFLTEIGIILSLSSLPDFASSACSLQNFTEVSPAVSLLLLYIEKIALIFISDVLAIFILYFLSMKIRNKIQAAIIMIIYLPAAQYLCMELLRGISL